MGASDHPWRRLGALPDWLVGFCHLSGNLWGFTDHNAKIIVLDSRLSQAQRRCTLAHELEHVNRGPVPMDPALAAREERLIDATVARRLIALDDLTDAATWTRRPAEAADLLWVDRSTLQVRINGLDDDERAEIEARVTDLYLP